MKPKVLGENNPKRPGMGWPIALGVIALIAWAFYFSFAISVVTPAWIPDWIHQYFLFHANADSATIMSTRGQFGDTFGAFNALVSTLALIGLLWTIRAQQQQLVDQDTHSRRSDQLIAQQQFQEQLYRAIDAYRELLVNIRVLASDANDDDRTGRDALNELWTRRLLAPLYLVRPDLAARDGGPDRRADVPKTALGVVGVAAYCEELQRNLSEKSSVLQSIGIYWQGIYSENRYQLDALFRSWYTVYRVLDTAPSYGLSARTISLYSASFRAQLSWIELAFLLINQSGLPPNPEFPKACTLSNKYVVFDNLAIEGDIIVSLLRAEADASRPQQHLSRVRLTGESFTGDVVKALENSE